MRWCTALEGCIAPIEDGFRHIGWSCLREIIADAARRYYSSLRSEGNAHDLLFSFAAF